MKLATWTAAIVIGGGLAVLAVYWAVTVLTALFDSDAPLPVKIAVPAVLLFWIGVFLLIYGRFYRRGQIRHRGLPSSPSRRNRHRGGRLG